MFLSDAQKYCEMDLIRALGITKGHCFQYIQASAGRAALVLLLRAAQQILGYNCSYLARPYSTWYCCIQMRPTSEQEPFFEKLMEMLCSLYLPIVKVCRVFTGQSVCRACSLLAYSAGTRGGLTKRQQSLQREPQVGSG